MRNYSTACSLGKNLSIDPWFITGLIDAVQSGCFVVTILKNPRYKTGWNVQARIQIKIHERDRDLIMKIREFFGGIGYISKPNKSNTIEYRVSSIRDIANVIIPHFDNYPLLTQKYFDYVLLKKIIKLMLEKEHNTLEGIKKIVKIKASINLGLSKKLKQAFPEVEKENKNISNNLNPPFAVQLGKQWMAGFLTAGSNFFIFIPNSKTKSGIAASLSFSIAHDPRDSFLSESFKCFFGCRYVTLYKNRGVREFTIKKIDHIINHVIPNLDKLNIRGSKNSDFLAFKNAAFIVKKSI
uniref:LAGLIDADG endonuclease n=1 Tax=Hirsutella thompsonii TaxID=42368 RepID=A0A3G2ZP20_HIRTH|nr:LAGLIDADG endonuclease [Hirsutella thompsonii]AYP41290.1 LAGLIDADG endonuclease [Hirsutella thompsonii]AYP41319.1 LAGLIDADG endonuclease [Hirsutella thompsonii]